MCLFLLLCRALQRLFSRLSSALLLVSPCLPWDVSPTQLVLPLAQGFPLSDMVDCPGCCPVILFPSLWWLFLSHFFLKTGKNAYYVGFLEMKHTCWTFYHSNFTFQICKASEWIWAVSANSWRPFVFTRGSLVWELSTELEEWVAKVSPSLPAMISKHILP